MRLRDFLDVAWAHFLSIAGSGAFANPFKVRAQIVYQFYGGDPPPVDEDDEKPKPGTAAAKTRRTQDNTRGITADKVAAMKAVQEQIDSIKAASIRQDE